MDYSKCRNCKEKVTHYNEEYFFYCSVNCMQTREKELLEKRKKENLTHNPPARRGEVDRTNEIIKQMLLRKDEPELNPNGKPKGKRKCGKCGEMGHNARTCKDG